MVRADSRAIHALFMNDIPEVDAATDILIGEGDDRFRFLVPPRRALRLPSYLVSAWKGTFLYSGAHISTSLESMILRSRVRTGKPCALAVATIARSAGSR